MVNGGIMILTDAYLRLDGEIFWLEFGFQGIKGGTACL